MLHVESPSGDKTVANRRVCKICDKWGAIAEGGG
jgi:hypothetical protein